jgi:beta-glucanase (GH16 family)
MVGRLPERRRRRRAARTRRIVLVLVLAAAASVLGVVVAFATSDGRPAPVPQGDTGPTGWNLIFDDEFDGSSLDTSLWSVGWFGSGITGPLTPAALECFDPARVRQHNGQLDLSFRVAPETCGGHRRPYTGAIVTTNGKFSFTYGFVEMKAKLPGAGGVVYDWPDFWTDGQNWPTDGEDDIVEGLHGQPCWHFHSPGEGPGACDSTPLGPGWHTFGADWEPGSVTYYYDGQVVGTITSGVTGAPMYLILSIGGNSQVGGPTHRATLRVAYVRVWQHPS